MSPSAEPNFPGAVQAVPGIDFLTSDIESGLSCAAQLNADLFFADSPYNLGFDYGKGAEMDRRSDANFLAWCRRWLTAGAAALRPGGSAWVLINEPFADEIGSMLNHIVGPRRNRIIWRETFGTYREQCFPSGHRHLFYHVKPVALGSFTWNPDAIRVESARMKMGDKRAGGKRPPEKMGRVSDDVWDVSRLCGTFKERVDWHPCQLPSMPLERLILATTNPGDLVLEAFSGSGSLARVCRALGRRYLGIDENPEYVAKAIDRVRAVEKCPQLVSGVDA